MALPSGFSTTLCNPISIRLVLLGLVVMPATELVLVFDVDGYAIQNEYVSIDVFCSRCQMRRRFQLEWHVGK